MVGAIGACCCAAASFLLAAGTSGLPARVILFPSGTLAASALTAHGSTRMRQVCPLRIRLIVVERHSGHSRFDAFAALSHLALAVAAAAGGARAHWRGVVGVETAQERGLVEGMHLAIQELLHNLGQLVGIILVMNEEHDSQVSSLPPSSLAEKRVVGFGDVGLQSQRGYGGFKAQRLVRWEPMRRVKGRTNCLLRSRHRHQSFENESGQRKRQEGVSSRAQNSVAKLLRFLPQYRQLRMS